MSVSEQTRYRVGPPSLVPDEAGLLLRVAGDEIGIFRLGDELPRLRERLPPPGRAGLHRAS